MDASYWLDLFCPTAFISWRNTGVIDRQAWLFSLRPLFFNPFTTYSGWGISPTHWSQNLVWFGCSELQLNRSSLCPLPNHSGRELLQSVWVCFQILGTVNWDIKHGCLLKLAARMGAYNWGVLLFKQVCENKLAVICFRLRVLFLLIPVWCL